MLDDAWPFLIVASIPARLGLSGIAAVAAETGGVLFLVGVLLVDVHGLRN